MAQPSLEVPSSVFPFLYQWDKISGFYIRFNISPLLAGISHISSASGMIVGMTDSSKVELLTLDNTKVSMPHSYVEEAKEKLSGLLQKDTVDGKMSDLAGLAMGLSANDVSAITGSSPLTIINRRLYVNDFLLERRVVSTVNPTTWRWQTVNPLEAFLERTVFGDVAVRWYAEDKLIRARMNAQIRQVFGQISQASQRAGNRTGLAMIYATSILSYLQKPLRDAVEYYLLKIGATFLPLETRLKSLSKSRTADAEPMLGLGAWVHYGLTQPENEKVERAFQKHLDSVGMINPHAGKGTGTEWHMTTLEYVNDWLVNKEGYVFRPDLIHALPEYMRLDGAETFPDSALLNLVAKDFQTTDSGFVFMA